MVSGLAPLHNPRAYRRSRFAREIGFGVFLRGYAPIVAPAGRGSPRPVGFGLPLPAVAPCVRKASAKKTPHLFSRLPP